MQWLTRKEKEQKMKQLNNAIKGKTVDKEFVYWLRKINKFDGICTTQCCTGHKKKKQFPIQGYLSLRMTRKLWDLFHQEQNILNLFNISADMETIMDTVPVPLSIGIKHNLERFGFSLRSRLVISWGTKKQFVDVSKFIVKFLKAYQ